MNEDSRSAVIIRIIGILLALALGIFAISLASAAVQELNTTPTTTTTLSSPDVCSDQYFYGFESTDLGWEAQRADDSQAISRVKQTTVMARSGHGALELQVDLDAGNPNKRSGETFINLAANPPIGLVAPFNLEDVPITIWFFVPAAATANTDAFIGVQIFVKDQLYRNEYSDWGNLANNTNRWIAFTFVPSRKAPEFGFMDNGFDPTQITIIGFKIGTKENSSADYSGSVWIDDVCWKMS